jgi:hypothetical protein
MAFRPGATALGAVRVATPDAGWGPDQAGALLTVLEFDIFCITIVTHNISLL